MHRTHQRARRLGEQLRREIAVLLRNEVRDPQVATAVPTRVQVTSDLSLARVQVQLRGTDADRVGELAALNRAAPFLRSRLSTMLEIRRVPELRFHEDRTLDAARRIEDLLQGEESPEADDSPDA